MIAFVTGASGYVGTALLKKLLTYEEIEKVVALDLKPLSLNHPKLDFYNQDIRHSLTPLLKKYRPEVVFHLAFILNPIHNLRAMYQINVEGTIQVIKACEKASVKRFIYPSSATVYGASPYNPVPIPESYPVNPYIPFSYPRHKAKVELFLHKFRKKSQMSYCILRPAVIFGPHVRNFMSQLLEGPFYIMLWKANPPFQLVHEEDVARAFYYVFLHRLSGIYNVAADGPFLLSEGAELYRRKPLVLPYPLVYLLVSFFWACRISPAPPQYLDYLRYPWVIDNSKLKEAGFSYQYTCRETLQTYLKARRKALPGRCA